MQNQYLLQHQVFIGAELQAQSKQSPVVVNISAMIISPKMTLKLCV